MIQLELQRSFPVEEYLLTRMAFAPSGEEIAVGHKQFRTYGAENGEIRRAFAGDSFLSQLRYSADGAWIAAANIGDNHPGTRGRVSVFAAGSGEERWRGECARPVEACAFAASGSARLLWNRDGAVAAAEFPAGRELEASLPPVPLQIRGLAALGDGGYAAFGREATGAVQQVEGADLIFRKFRLLSVGAGGQVRNNIDLGIGAGVHALSPDGKLLAVEMVDFKNNERHVSLVDTETGVEANLLSLEANTLPVLEFGLGSEYFLCMKEDAAANYNLIRVWRTADLKLLGEAQVELGFHSLATNLEHSQIALLGSGKLEIFALS